MGRPETEDAYEVETIRSALAAKIAADFPACESPVRTTVSAGLALDGYGPRSEVGIRFEAYDCERLPVPCTEDEVRAAGERLRKSVAEGLADIAQYWDDQAQAPKAWAKMVAESADRNAAARSRDDA